MQPGLLAFWHGCVTTLPTVEFGMLHVGPARDESGIAAARLVRPVHGTANSEGK